jgi:DNA repair protein RadC
MQARSEDPPVYAVVDRKRASADDDIIAQAIALLEERLRNTNEVLSSPTDVKNFLRLKLAQLEHEVFGVLFLNAQHRVIEWDEMFRGTLSQTSVYPREVVKRALELNAGAVILAHNHPSGMAEPSRADEFITQTLKSALALIDVRVLDHIVVGSAGTVSLAERGLI